MMSSLFRNYRTYCSILNFSTRARNRDYQSSVKNCVNFLPPKQFLLHNSRGLSTEAQFTLENPAVRKYLDNVIKKYDMIKAGNDTLHKNREIEPLVGLLESRLSIVENISSLDELGKDKEIKELVAEEQSVYKTHLALLDQELIEALLSTTGEDDHNDVILEITAGVGGQEAMLFARDLYGMYLGYLDYLGYDYELIEHGLGDAGGTRHAIVSVSGEGAFSALKYEAGVHRVQRIPATEKAGRVHTSTVTVAVLPQPSEIEISLADRDLKIETKRASGAGGQHVNTTDSAVRIVHLPTGIAAECQTGRSQIKNKQMALQTLRARIYAQELGNQENMKQELRRSQQGLGFRNEKIRTYNYQQNRVTDHRIPNGTMNNLKGFLEGGEANSKLIKSLKEGMRKDMFLKIVAEAQNS